MPLSTTADRDAAVRAEVERLQVVDHLLALVLGELEELELDRRETPDEALRRYEKWVAAERPAWDYEEWVAAGRPATVSSVEVEALRDRVIELAEVESTLDDLARLVKDLRVHAVAQVRNRVDDGYHERVAAALARLTDSQREAA
jgi:hypothetical protein